MDENGHSNRNFGYGIRRQKALEQKICCKFARTEPDKEDFDIFKAINGHIKQLTKKNPNRYNFNEIIRIRVWIR